MTNYAFVNETHVFVNETHVFINKTHAFVDETHAFVNETHAFIDETHAFVDETHNFVDNTVSSLLENAAPSAVIPFLCEAAYIYPLAVAVPPCQGLRCTHKSNYPP
ncbi:MULTISPECIES: hypothetical protein [Nostoc]|uniref:Uncharacterized protein n=1 Tax=Nostoc paludosum FACHB-159 TaxID=2692908 RepID=A0ABR8K7H3_9NOSO|nr:MULTISPECIES: hypothetical protein [Nostoc]MBD2677495.1 hypothetical protein [Nostoc sp. FACHB-857]MBD2734112.1 hypothetical protein [Nostoc paludosum FACHB-159]